MLTSKPVKSFTLRVTTVKSCSSAVAASQFDLATQIFIAFKVHIQTGKGRIGEQFSEVAGLWSTSRTFGCWFQSL